MQRIRLVYDNEGFKIEYDRNLDEYFFTAPENGWVRGRDVILGALAVLSFYVKESV